jgi:hypothetical protein
MSYFAVAVGYWRSLDLQTIDPSILAATEQLLELLRAQPVVHQTSQRNGVAKVLKRSDWIAEDGHGSHDQEDVLEHTRKGQNDCGRLADLDNISAIAISKWLTLLTKSTTETFSKNAHMALASRVP